MQSAPSALIALIRATRWSRVGGALRAPPTLRHQKLKPLRLKNKMESLGDIFRATATEEQFTQAYDYFRRRAYALHVVPYASRLADLVCAPLTEKFSNLRGDLFYVFIDTKPPLYSDKEILLYSFSILDYRIEKEVLSEIKRTKYANDKVREIFVEFLNNAGQIIIDLNRLKKILSGCPWEEFVGRLTREPAMTKSATKR